MAVSEERIDELLDDMINNADSDGWCHVPEGLSEEEQDELSKRLTIITMQDRIDELLEGISTVMEHMVDIKEHINGYDTMARLRIKGGLEVMKEDSQGLLMDLHSEDIVSDFFRVEMVVGETDEQKEEVSKVKEGMQVLVDTIFKDQLDKIKKYCSSMIEMSDEIVERLDKE